MPRIKVKHESNFTVVQNDFIYDKALDSFDRGVLLFMLTKKDDYCFSVERISKEIDKTKQKVSKSLKKLTEAGYLERRQATRNNRFAEAVELTEKNIKHFAISILKLSSTSALKF